MDCALFDPAVAMMAVMNMNYLVTGTPPGRAGNAHQNIVPYQVFACAEGHLILAVGNDAQFGKFCAVFADPQVVARGLRVDLPHPLAGQVPLVEPSLRMSGAPLVTERAPPLLAADTETVLRERLGLFAATVARRAAAGVIGLPR